MSKLPDVSSSPVVSVSEAVVHAAPASAHTVCSYNDWDPLEEVVVGDVNGAAVPPWHVALEVTMPRNQRQFFETSGGRPFPAECLDAARREIDAFVERLCGEGVTVRRPDVVDHTRPFATPEWSSTGLYAAMPRDVLLVVGDCLIEAPMAWRSRYFEAFAYRGLLRSYFWAGARWISAPKPRLRDEFYREPLSESGDSGDGFTPDHSVIGEDEPTFDAADVIRCGRDLFIQQSHVTNGFGVEWLRRHLDPPFRVHDVRFEDEHPMHVDATLVPLAPGRALINPERVPEMPPMFKDWEPLVAPRPEIPNSHPMHMSSAWVSMNVLSLDDRTVIVESSETELRCRLKTWGFEAIPCDFRHFNSLGGSFHCATLDVRRRGTLRSYF